MSSFLVPRFGLAVGALLLSSLLPLGASASSLIQNGSFEEGIDPGPFVTLSAGSNSITAWEIIGQSVDYIGSVWMASHGERSIDLEGNAIGGVQQAFATTIGVSYVVTFDMAGNPVGGVPIKEMNVSAGDNNQNFQFDTTGSTLEAMNWLTQTFTFTATSTTTTLAFLAVSPGDGFGAALDNVAVNPVPEPSTFLLLGAGLAGLAYLRRRRA